MPVPWKMSLLFKAEGRDGTPIAEAARKAVVVVPIAETFEEAAEMATHCQNWGNRIPAGASGKCLSYEAIAKDLLHGADIPDEDKAIACGIKGAPKELLAWLSRTAWEKGHSGGLTEVWLHYWELSEVVRIAVKLIAAESGKAAEAAVKFAEVFKAEE